MSQQSHDDHQLVKWVSDETRSPNGTFADIDDQHPDHAMTGQIFGRQQSQEDAVDQDTPKDCRCSELGQASATSYLQDPVTPCPGLMPTNYPPGAVDTPSSHSREFEQQDPTVSSCLMPLSSPPRANVSSLLLPERPDAMMNVSTISGTSEPEHTQDVDCKSPPSEGTIKSDHDNNESVFGQQHPIVLSSVCSASSIALASADQNSNFSDRNLHAAQHGEASLIEICPPLPTLPREIWIEIIRYYLNTPRNLYVLPYLVYVPRLVNKELYRTRCAPFRQFPPAPYLDGMQIRNASQLPHLPFSPPTTVSAFEDRLDTDDACMLDRKSGIEFWEKVPTALLFTNKEFAAETLRVLCRENQIIFNDEKVLGRFLQPAPLVPKMHYLRHVVISIFSSCCSIDSPENDLTASLPFMSLQTLTLPCRDHCIDCPRVFRRGEFIARLQKAIILGNLQVLRIRPRWVEYQHSRKCTELSCWAWNFIDIRSHELECPSDHCTKLGSKDPVCLPDDWISYKGQLWAELECGGTLAIRKRKAGDPDPEEAGFSYVEYFSKAVDGEDEETD